MGETVDNSLLPYRAGDRRTLKSWLDSLGADVVALAGSSTRLPIARLATEEAPG